MTSCAAWSECSAARRSRSPLTQGFNPRPKMTFALALGLGIEGLCEVVDLELAEPLEPTELADAAESRGSPRLRLDRRPPAAADAPPPQPRTVEYRIPVLDERRRTAQSLHLQSLLASESWPLTRRRPNRESTFDLRPALDRGRADGRGAAPISFEGLSRRLRTSRRTARGPRASRPAGPRSRLDSD